LRSAQRRRDISVLVPRGSIEGLCQLRLDVIEGDAASGGFDAEACHGFIGQLKCHGHSHEVCDIDITT